MPPHDLAECFSRQGWVVVRNLLDKQLIARLLDHVLDFYAGKFEIPRILPLPSYLSWDHSQDGEVLRTNEYVLQLDDFFKQLLTGPLGPTAAVLAGTEYVRLWVSSLITKMPSSRPEDTLTEVGWHTDIAYWPTCSSERMLTAWIPLTECAGAEGALQFLDGSHRWTGSYSDRLRSLRSFRKPQAIRLADLEDHGLTPRVGSPRYQPGDVGFHHCRVVHRSGGNFGRDPRIALSLHLQDKDNEYVRAATSHFNDGLARVRSNGNPDYADPAWFPALRRYDER